MTASDWLIGYAVIGVVCAAVVHPELVFDLICDLLAVVVLWPVGVCMLAYESWHRWSK